MHLERARVRGNCWYLSDFGRGESGDLLKYRSSFAPGPAIRGNSRGPPRGIRESLWERTAYAGWTLWGMRPQGRRAEERGTQPDAPAGQVRAPRWAFRLPVVRPV